MGSSEMRHLLSINNNNNNNYFCQKVKKKIKRVSFMKEQMNMSNLKLSQNKWDNYMIFPFLSKKGEHVKLAMGLILT